jgi:CBS domain-containing protein
VPQSIRELMTANPVALPSSSPLNEAAQQMKQRDIGDVIVLDGGTVCGVVTDRDIVVRALAEDKDPASTTLGEICSRDLISLSPSDSVEDAIRLMRERAIRRLPIVEAGQPVGIVSIGDLAVARDATSALADISSARPNE